MHRNSAHDSDDIVCAVSDLLGVLQHVTLFCPDFIISIVKDDGSSYPTPEWERSKEPAYAPSPVGYVRDSRMVVEVTLQADGAISDGPIYIKGDGPDGLEFPVVQDTLSGGAVTAALQSDILPDAVEYWDLSEFQVTWLYARNADGPWYDAGTSQNQLYVTLGQTPLINPSPVYHTLIHLGCENARGESSESLVVDKVWNEFTDRDVRRMDGEQLRYYHDWEHKPEDFKFPNNTADLLKEADGDCAAWAKFFIDMLRVQGILLEFREIVEKSHPEDYGILIKEWEFIGSGTSPETHPYVYIGKEDAFDKYPNVVRGQGQGNNDPPPQFFNHFIVKYEYLYYDPSYGTGPFADDQQWENMSIDGTHYDVAKVWYIKKNDPALTEIKFRWKLYW